jgi:hypothetical protein
VVLDRAAVLGSRSLREAARGAASIGVDPFREVVLELDPGDRAAIASGALRLRLAGLFVSVVEALVLLAAVASDDYVARASL